MKKFKITDAANTYNIAAYLLDKLGFSLSLKDEDEDYIIYLFKGKQIIYSHSDPLGLLGVAYLHSHQRTMPKEWNDKSVSTYANLAIKEVSDLRYSISITNIYSNRWFDWLAENTNYEVIASTPLGLLGLIIILSEYGKEWRNIDAELPDYLENI